MVFLIGISIFQGSIFQVSWYLLGVVDLDDWLSFLGTNISLAQHILWIIFLWTKSEKWTYSLKGLFLSCFSLFGLSLIWIVLVAGHVSDFDCTLEIHSPSIFQEFPLFSNFSGFQRPVQSSSEQLLQRVLKNSNLRLFWICGSLTVFAGVLRLFAGVLRVISSVFN